MIDGIIVIFIILIFILAIMIIEILHYKERRDLYNRMMAKDLTEYNQVQQTKKRESIKSMIFRNKENFYNKK